MNDERIWKKLVSTGFTKEGTAGLMGNLYAESMLNPKNLQNSFERKLGHTDESYTQAVDSGKYKNFVKDGAGYGLAQWTYYTRKDALLAYAKEQKKSIGDLDMQLDFLIRELQGSYAKVFKALCTTNSVREAAIIVLTQYEKPAIQTYGVKNLRSAYAQKFYDLFANAFTEEEKTNDTANGSFRVRVVDEEGLNVRKGPGVAYDINTKVYKGEVFTIVETDNAVDCSLWGKLKSGAGWINLSCKYVEMIK